MSANPSDIVRDKILRLGKTLGIIVLLFAFAIAVLVVAPERLYIWAFIVGPGLAAWSVGKLWRYYQAKAWIETSAILTGIEERLRDVTVYISSVRYLYPEVTYQFEIGGTKYSGTSASIEPENIWVHDYDRHKSVWADWAPGSRVRVYYDRKNPNRSVIVRELSRARRSHYLALFTSGILVSIVGLLVTYAKG